MDAFRSRPGHRGKSCAMNGIVSAMPNKPLRSLEHDGRGAALAFWAVRSADRQWKEIC